MRRITKTEGNPHPFMAKGLSLRLTESVLSMWLKLTISFTGVPLLVLLAFVRGNHQKVGFDMPQKIPNPYVQPEITTGNSLFVLQGFVRKQHSGARPVINS